MTIGRRILDSMERLTTLEIVTAVGPTPLGPGGAPDLRLGGDAQVMVTRIRLLEGDITTKMDEAFVTGVHAPLRAFHEEQVARGLQIVKDNINALGELYRLLRQVEADEQRPAK